MPYLTLGFLALLSVWIQACLWSPWALAGVRPDVLFILSVFLALHGEEDEWPTRYWALGLLKDIFSSGPLGLHAASFTLVGVAVRKARSEIFRDHPLTRALVVFLSALVAGGLAAAVQTWSILPDSMGDLAARVLLESVLAAALAPVLMPFYMLFRAFLGIRPVRDLSRAL